MTSADERAARAHALGRRGEDLAAAELTRRGFTVVARNLRRPRAEFDLIAEDRHGLAFVEVKSRTGRRYGEPWQAVDDRGRERRAAEALAWLEESGRGDADFRFGIASVVFDEDGDPVSFEWFDEVAD